LAVLQYTLVAIRHREGRVVRPGEQLITSLRLEPHPEGGWYRRTWQAPAADGERPWGSAIYYLLLEGEVSAPHRIDATELWHFYAGAPLELTRRTDDDEQVQVTILGPDVMAGHEPQIVVEPRVWQSAHSLGSFSFVGVTVTPAFTFEGFELRDGGSVARRSGV
jgi:predicted cupin superfamily sugar epimerase